MIISEITLVNSYIVDLYSITTGVLTLKSTSRSNKNIVSEKWTTEIITSSGNPNILIPNTNGIFSPLIENQDLTITFSWEDIEEFIVTLTVTDDEGKESVTSVQIVNDNTYPDPTYWVMYGIKTNDAMLPNGIVEFIPEPYVIDLFTMTDITESNIGETYTFDKYNDTIDVTTSTLYPTTFQGSYGTDSLKDAKLSININGGEYNQPNDLEAYLIVQFIPTNGDRDLVLTSENECKELVAYSETKDYLDKLVGRTPNDTMFNLKTDVTINCCNTAKFSFDLAPHYNFTVTSSDCTNKD